MGFWRFGRRDRTSGGDDDPSVFDRLRREQTTRWAGVPVTVCFDYQPYLREATRRRVNVHTLLESQHGEHTLVGYCHDQRADHTFKLASIVGQVLLERTGESLSPRDFAARLAAEGREHA
jgi:hypothetical protein